MSSNANHLPKVKPNGYSARGWQDYLAQRPYPPEYEKNWDQVSQRHYERGRLRAAGAHLIYRHVPANEPYDIVERTNGLKLVPKNVEKKRHAMSHAVRPLSPTSHMLH
jgi:hypothetical protein